MWIIKNDETQQRTTYLTRPSEEVSDETLMHAISSGAVWAMEALYQRYHHILYSFAYRIVTDHQIVEDLLQESFFAVWRRATSYSSQSGEVRSWLISIVHHRAIDYLRTLRSRAQFTRIPLDEVDLDSSVASPDVWDQAWQSTQRIQVQEALMTIPKEQRMVIELAYFQGWTHSEIAKGCQLPLGTVKARMRLGLIHLKRALQQKGVYEL